jgi:signal transduction histidine kinase
VLYGSFFILGLFDAAYSFIKGNKKTKQIAIIILSASIISWVSGASNFPLWFGINILPFGNFLVFIYVFLFGYAMMKYNLMNIKLAFTQVLILLVNAFAIIIIFTSSTPTEYVIKILFAIMVFILSYFLHKSFDNIADQRKQLEKSTAEIKRSNKELKRLDKAKSEFISIASHQLRTPLTAIKGYISLMLEGAYGEVSPEIETALNKVFLANERIIQLVEDLLNITRMDSGRLEYHYDDNVQIEDILEELKDTFVLRLKEKDLDFKIELPDKKLPPIRADKSKLREVISNLIDNAIKYTKEGYVHVTVEQKRKFIRITVKDSGVGISKESLKSLFTKFSRGTDNTKVYTEGTGLGLYVGKSLIEEQGGRIYAKSGGMDKGSEFIVEMPIQ